MAAVASARPPDAVSADRMAGLAVGMEQIFPVPQVRIPKILVVAVDATQLLGGGNGEDVFFTSQFVLIVVMAFPTRNFQAPMKDMVEFHRIYIADDNRFLRHGNSSGLNGNAAQEQPGGGYEQMNNAFSRSHNFFPVVVEHWTSTNFVEDQFRRGYSRDILNDNRELSLGNGKSAQGERVTYRAF
jgi:hypothetical protein